ncbi:hypothetical protein A33O_08536 [Nitratireductor aquibiodomus RA22]|jgi:hypothetical protein|uniref:DUF3572 domain-containing protein n=2 Tax=Nitratireductor aquibiodomus TaxID=204799 RepID=A0A1H4IXK9_9HYPH|nr:DUF3572 domain-containing protein [Nitratireductor aquibiodomus]EIM75283.1 hypothetical protein A33O_08536 [Nitratireductor aquibiodomus RA22]SEB38002.1 Protein of unknown function [Nitratireductor aquibiodomus]
MQREEAEAIAVSALAFIAADDQLLPRFLSLTGIEANQIRAAAAEPGFLTGVLQFILAHEPTLLRFSEENGIAPRIVAQAPSALPHGNTSYDIQP